MRKDGKEKRRVWRKLHLAIDDSTHEVISAVVNLATVGDNVAVNALKSGNLEDWKREEGYHQRSLSETGMSRYKTLTSPKLTLRNYDA